MAAIRWPARRDPPADISVANLECVIATAGRRVDKDYSFLGKPNGIPILKRHFTAIAVANNHACDYGPVELLSQLKLFDEQKLSYFGGGTAAEARRPLIFGRNGRRIALLNYCGAESPEIAAGPRKPGVAWLVKADVLADIRSARGAQHADIVIPFLHWGLQGDTPPPTPSALWPTN